MRRKGVDQMSVEKEHARVRLHFRVGNRVRLDSEEVHQDAYAGRDAGSGEELI